MKLLITLLIPVSLIAIQDKYIVPTQEEREQLLATFNDLGCRINKKYVTDMLLSKNLKEVILVFATTQMTRNRDTGALVHHYRATGSSKKSKPKEILACDRE